MYWGAGPELGLLTFIGYLIFFAGAVTMWRGRVDVSTWLESEVGVLRRNLSRHTLAGPFYSPRGESRLKTLPTCFATSIRRMPLSLVCRVTVRLVTAPVLVLLDFFI